MKLNSGIFFHFKFKLDTISLETTPKKLHMLKSSVNMPLKK